MLDKLDLITITIPQYSILKPPQRQSIPEQMINRKMGLEIQSSQTTTTGNLIIVLWVEEEEEEIQSANTYNDTGEH